MNTLKHVIAGLLLTIALLPQAVSADSNRLEMPLSAKDHAAEDKARSFFTGTEVIDQNGNKLRFYSDVLKDRVVLISFLFTNCEYACPMQAQKLNQARAMMVPAIKDKVWFVSLSVDPERDTPAAWKEFAKNQAVDESRWIFLTGDKPKIQGLIRKLGQFTEDIDAHTTLMLAGNTITRHWTRVLPMVPPEGIAQQMRNLVEESPEIPG